MRAIENLIGASKICCLEAPDRADAAHRPKLKHRADAARDDDNTDNEHEKDNDNNNDADKDNDTDDDMDDDSRHRHSHHRHNCLINFVIAPEAPKCPDHHHA